MWTLGFKESGATMRTASLARDFQALAAMVDPTTPAYLLVFVGDVPERPAGLPNANWLLISRIDPPAPATRHARWPTTVRGSKQASERNTSPRAVCGAYRLSKSASSNYMRSLDATGESSGSPMRLGSPEKQELAAAKIQSIQRRNSSSRSKTPVPATPASVKAAVMPGGGFGVSATGGVEVEPLSDATEAIWEERIKGVRHAYYDSCTRLVSSLEELEQTLCSLTGDSFRPDEPILRARAHISKNLELLQ